MRTVFPSFQARVAKYGGVKCLGGTEENRACPHERMEQVRKHREAYRNKTIYYCPGEEKEYDDNIRGCCSHNRADLLPMLLKSTACGATGPTGAAALTATGTCPGSTRRTSRTSSRPGRGG